MKIAGVGLEGRMPSSISPLGEISRVNIEATTKAAAANRRQRARAVG